MLPVRGPAAHQNREIPEAGVDANTSDDARATVDRMDASGGFHRIGKMRKKLEPEELPGLDQ